MRRKAVSLVLTFFLAVSLPVMAFAATRANFKGNIWTGWPNALGMGYYCTAAQNESGGDTIHKASAWSKNASGEIIAKKSVTGNGRAVADSGKTKPHSGYGEYWEEDANGNKIPDCIAHTSFTAKAYEPSLK